MTIYALGDKQPIFPDGPHWIAPDANVIGDIWVGALASIWFGATLRGDNERITVGAGSNIQENCVLHTDMGFPLVIGENCTIGHKALLHGCVIGDNSLIGMGAMVMNGAVVGKNCLIGAGSLITEGKVIPDNSLVMGVPGRVVREIDAAAAQRLTMSALSYQQKMAVFATDMRVVSA